MSRLRWRTVAISTVTCPVTVPNCAPWRARCETFALQISFLLGKQLMLGQEPPIYRRSTTIVFRPDRAICHARSLPPAPLPRTRISYRSGWNMLFLLVLFLRYSNDAPIKLSLFMQLRARIGRNPFQLLWRDALSGKCHSQDILPQQIDGDRQEHHILHQERHVASHGGEAT